MAQKFASVDDYISSFPDDVQTKLREVRAAILRAVPDAEEGIRYNMPFVGIDGTYLVHYAGWKRHIGLYPVPPLDSSLEAEVAPHRAAKDTVRFLLRDPVPTGLVERVTAALRRRRAAG